MSLYSDAVDATTPINYWRLIELFGPTIVDTGSAPVDGTYDDDAVFGRPSPIESDAAAFAIGGPAGIANAPVPVDNFSFGGWGYYDPTNIGASTIVCRNGQIGTPNSNMIIVDHGLGTIYARLNHDGSPGGFVDLTYAPPVAGWYWVSVSRNGTVVNFMINDFIADSASSFPAGPMTNPTWISGGGFGWKLGVGGDSGNIFSGLGTAEVPVWDYPITLADHQAIYYAALNALLLNGYSNVIPSAILYSDIDPDPISFPFRHNWADPLIERLSFATGVSTATKGYEQANSQRIKPRREIEISQVLRDDEERRALRAKLTAHQRSKWFIPILDHRDRLNTTIASGVSVFTVDTLYKDYEVGGYFGLRQLDGAGRITQSEELLIAGLTDSEITTTTATVNSYVNPECYPVRRAIIDAQVQPRGHTDAVEELTITAQLVAEDEQAIPRRIAAWTPLATYKGHEVFPVAMWPNDWSELRDYEVSRTRADVDFDLGPFATESDTLAGNETFSWRIILQTLQQQAEFLGWFYARAGSLNYLWVPTMQRDFAIVSTAGGNLTVEKHNYFDNFAGSEFRRDLAFTYHDNTLAMARINSVALVGANEVLSLNTLPTLTNLRSVSYLLFCRLDSDVLERAAVTDTKARFAWRFREMLSSPD